MKFFILILAYTIICTSCAAHKFIETDLYFGLSKPGGKIIDDTTWNHFVAVYIAKVYTQGFTQITSEGKWLDINTNQLGQEPSRIIISVNKMTKLLSLKIDSIRQDYKKIFNQQAVLRVDKKVEHVLF